MESVTYAVVGEGSLLEQLGACRFLRFCAIMVIIIPDSFGDDRRGYISAMSTSAKLESQVERHMGRDI